MLIYIFDVDGTLTPPRKSMELDFLIKFMPFLKNNIVYIVSGSDYYKIKEQIPNDILKDFNGIFSSMGNEFYIKDKLIYDTNFIPDESLLEELEHFRAITKYHGKLYDNYIEIRKGMINFSSLGRNCTYEARKQYNKWDNIYKEREQIYKLLKEKYTNYDISVGGEISIDITPLGKGKEQVIDYLRNLYPNSTLIFGGDKIKEGGNDYTIAQKCYASSNCQVIEVESPNKLLKVLNLN